MHILKSVLICVFYWLGFHSLECLKPEKSRRCCPQRTHCGVMDNGKPDGFESESIMDTELGQRYSDFVLDNGDRLNSAGEPAILSISRASRFFKRDYSMSSLHYFTYSPTRCRYRLGIQQYRNNLLGGCMF
jgi:hypothetical protein